MTQCRNEGLPLNAPSIRISRKRKCRGVRHKVFLIRSSARRGCRLAVTVNRVHTRSVKARRSINVLVPIHSSLTSSTAQ